MIKPEGPLSLAALRIAVPLIAIVSPGFHEGLNVARLPPASFVVPEGLGWFVRLVPIDARVAIAMQLVAAFSALAAAAGIRARLALAGLFVSLFYLSSIAQLTGFVWHDMHILWMIALLAASPCDHALAWDARVTRPPSIDYAVPLWFARALLACVYFFPGVWKLATQGPAWVLSDNLQNQLWWKWAEHGAVGWRIDRIPGALQTGGLFVLAFELLFPVLVVFSRARPFLAIAGIVFHGMAQLVFRIPFLSLLLCYVALIDLRLPRLREAKPIPSWRWPAIAVGSALVLGAVVQGLRGQMQSYPFACYPTFQWNPGTHMPDLRVEAVRANGETVIVDRGPRSQRDWGTVWNLVGDVSEPRLRAWYARRAHPSDAVRVRFWRMRVSVDPDAPGEERAELLLEISVAAGVGD